MIEFDVSDALAAESNKFKLVIRENVFIKLDKPILSRVIKLFPSTLFD